MNNLIKQSIFLSLTLFSGLSANAQKGESFITPNIGVTTLLLSEAIGVHIGVNPSYAVSSHFSIEGQVSYSYTRINGAFISGARGLINSFNALAGGRLYFIQEDKSVRPYINLLIGANQFRELSETLKETRGFKIGFSAGAYVEIQKFLLGVSLDSPENFIFKVGYVL